MANQTNFSLKKITPARELRPRRRTWKKQVLIKYSAKTTTVKRDIINNKTIDKEHTIAISTKKSSNKLYKPKSYDKAVNNPVYGCQWQKTIKKEL